ncbi:unnamed protein product, partial [Prorocentrum cordatum]
ASIVFLGENVTSVPECAVIRPNQLFGRTLPEIEAEPVVVRAKTQNARCACGAALETERPPLEEWLPAGAACSGPAAGELLPTLGRWMPCSQLRPRPADIEECSAAELARWEAAGFASPPYQFSGKWCMHRADHRVEPPGARIREKLMVCPEDHTVPCMMSSEAETEPAKYNALQQLLAGNSFQCEVVAGMISHWAFGAGRLVRVPSLGELHESARAWPAGKMLWAGDVPSLHCGRSEIDEGLHAILDALAVPST